MQIHWIGECPPGHLYLSLSVCRRTYALIDGDSSTYHVVGHLWRRVSALLIPGLHKSRAAKAYSSPTCASFVKDIHGSPLLTYASSKKAISGSSQVSSTS